ncbi:MAG: cation transporter [Xanthomonadales bacterium]|nr:cation transporter [Xanthomonadales bacterium]
MGIVGAILVARWSYGLIRDTSQVLLDKQAGERHLAELRESIEAQSTDRVTDLPRWSIGHGIFAAEIVVVSDNPKTPEQYKSRISPSLKIVHSALEIHRNTHE